MRVRKSARLVLLDKQDRVLMFKYEDKVPLDPEHPITLYWATLGGGLEGDETFEQAAMRELWEETGITEAAIGPCLWTRERKFVIHGEDVLSQERYFLVRVPGDEISLDNLFENERLTYRDHRWWSTGEMRRSGDVFLPLGLADLLEPVLTGQLPPEPFQIDVPQK
ncbi:MAG TPA: NUDIX domain-containing protein [Chloroflexia bacterium]|jgi:8-oxo-dGTP pyrophosphatase MutT (NUDIX family)